MNVDQAQRTLFINEISLSSLGKYWLGRQVIEMTHHNTAERISAAFGWVAAAGVHFWIPASTDEGRAVQRGVEIVSALTAAAFVASPLQRVANSVAYGCATACQMGMIVEATRPDIARERRVELLKDLEGMFVLPEAVLNAYCMVPDFRPEASDIPKKRVFIYLLQIASPIFFYEYFKVSEFRETGTHVISREVFSYMSLLEETIHFLKRPAGAKVNKDFMDWPYAEWRLQGLIISEERCKTLVLNSFPPCLGKYYPDLFALLKARAEEAIAGKPGEDLFLAARFLSVMQGCAIRTELWTLYSKPGFGVLLETEFLAFLYYLACTDEVDIIFREKLGGLAQNLRDSFGERDTTPLQVIRSLVNDDPLVTYFRHTQFTGYKVYISLEKLQNKIDRLSPQEFEQLETFASGGASLPDILRRFGL